MPRGARRRGAAPAQEFGALVVFAEHRYYGTTLPFGNATFADPKSGLLQWLTSEQALADYAELVAHLKVRARVRELNCGALRSICTTVRRRRTTAPRARSSRLGAPTAACSRRGSV